MIVPFLLEKKRYPKENNTKIWVVTPYSLCSLRLSEVQNDWTLRPNRFGTRFFIIIYLHNSVGISALDDP